MTETRLRFPPSPTGYLHIGGARTALYNWLYARKTGGKLILRIEDTDAERSTQESIQGILDGLEWLGIDWDEGPYFQTEFESEHEERAQKLLEEGKAYKCFCTKEELDAKREAAQKNKSTYGYDGKCRHLSQEEAAEKEAAGLPFVVRFKVPEKDGEIGYDDKVLGRIKALYSEIEDFVIVRSTGKPLYLLCNVVDDIRDRSSIPMTSTCTERAAKAETGTARRRMEHKKTGREEIHAGIKERTFIFMTDDSRFYVEHLHTMTILFYLSAT